MMIEVFTENEKNKLLEMGLKLIHTRKVENYDVFVFEYRKNLNFDLSDINFKPTNKLYF